MSKWISLCGPPFAGKSFLVSQLIEDFSDFKTISFEKYCNYDVRSGYNYFYDNIKSLLSSGYNVISESIYNHLNNPYYKFSSKDINCKIIYCCPLFQEYQFRLLEFEVKYGKKELEKRIGNLIIGELFNKYKYYNDLHYNSTNYLYIKEEIQKWL